MRLRAVSPITLAVLGLAFLATPAAASDVEMEAPGTEAVTEHEDPEAAMEMAIPDVADTSPPVGHVERSSFTTAVVDREPQDAVDTLTNDHVQIAYFTEARGMAGSRLTHRWEHQGRVMAEVSFDVGGQRWRTHSVKTLDPEMLGEWQVSVLSNGKLLATESFRYVEFTTAASAPAEAAEETPDASAEASEAASSPAPPPDEPNPPAAPQP